MEAAEGMRPRSALTVRRRFTEVGRGANHGLKRLPGVDLLSVWNENRVIEASLWAARIGEEFVGLALLRGANASVERPSLGESEDFLYSVSILT